MQLVFAQNFFNSTLKRLFTLVVENEVFPDVDLFAIGGYRTAFTITVAKIVDDGFVSIRGIGRVNKAKISGIEIVLKEVHTTHPVSQGPVSRFYVWERIVMGDFPPLTYNLRWFCSTQ